MLDLSKTRPRLGLGGVGTAVAAAVASSRSHTFLLSLTECGMVFGKDR